jgi:hypothetical protein
MKQGNTVGKQKAASDFDTFSETLVGRLQL